MHYIIILIICAIVFTIDNSTYLPFHTPKNFILIAFVPVILCINLAKCFIRKDDIPFFISIIDILLLLRLIWATITNPALIIHPSALGFWILLLLIILTIFIRQLPPDQKQRLITYFLRSFWIMGVIQTGIGFYQLYIHFDYDPQIIKTPMFGTIGSPNGYGLFMAISIIALLFEFKNFKNKYFKTFLGLCGVLMLTALILNGSRGALFALICSVIVIIFYLKSWIIYLWNTDDTDNTDSHWLKSKIKSVYNPSNQRHLCSIIVIIIIALSVILIGLYHIDKESSSGRLMVWQISAPMFFENPVTGVGFNRLSIEYLNYQARYFKNPENLDKSYKAANLKQVHNEYLQSFCETGFIGGILFLSIWIAALWILYRKIKYSIKSKNVDNNIIALFSILIVILIHALVDTPLHVLPISVIAYIILGMIPAHPELYKINIPSKIIKFGVFIIFITFAVFMTNKSIKQYPAYKEWGKGYEYNHKRQLIQAIPLYQSALIRLPGQGELEFHLGSAMALTGGYSRGLYHLQESLVNYNDRNIHLSMSYAYLKLRNFNKAENSAKIALSMFPDHLAPHLLLGEIYFLMGDTVNSKKSLQKCIRCETKIQSPEVEQIKIDAKNLWRKFYKKY